MDNNDLERIRKELQKLIGDYPKVEIEHFKNWSTSRKIENLFVVKPRSLNEIQRVVKAAKSLKLRVRCAGATHSWGPLFPDEANILLYTKDIRRHDGPQIELIQNPGEDTKVNVMCSTNVQELMDFELKHKVNLPANVVLREPTYGGIVGAGCHGVGWDFYSVSDYCTQMRIIDHNGNLRTFSKKDDKDMMLAIQCNLGMFGIMYDMQLEVMEQKIVHVKNDFSYKAGDLFYNPEKLKKVVEENDSVELFYWPYSSVSWLDAAEQLTKIIGTHQSLSHKEWDPKKDGTWLKLVNIPDQSKINPKKVVGDCYYKILDIKSWLESKGITVADEFIINCPQELTPLAEKAAYKYAKKSNNEEIYQPLANAIHYRPHLGLLSVSDMEWAFNVTEDFSNITNACQAVIEILREEAEKGKFPLNICMEMRWMKYSDAYLCPAIAGNPAVGGSGHTVYLEVLSYTNTPGWEEFANRVADEWKKIPGARPHWAKEWDFLDNIDTYLRKTWCTEMKKFSSALDRSGCDPHGMFLNDRLQKIFFSGKSGKSDERRCKVTGCKMQ